MTSPPGRRLPPVDGDPARLLFLSGAVATEYDTDDVIADALDVLDPDVVVGTEPDGQLVGPALARTGESVFAAGRGVRTVVEPVADGAVVVVFPPDPGDLPPSPGDVFERDHVPDDVGAAEDRADDVGAAEDGADDVGAADDGTDDAGAKEDGSRLDRSQVVVVTDAVSLSVDPTRRETRLDGAGEYVAAVGAPWCRRGVTHVSTGLRPGYRGRYRHDGEELAIHGAGRPAGGLGAGVDDREDDLAVLDVYPNGCVVTRTPSPDRFGLRGLDGVSETRAERLRRAGYASHEDVARARVDDLTDVRSVGRETAQGIRAAARAVADGTVVRTGDGSLPSGDPIHVDVETDGLGGSRAWLVGVLDGDASTGNYMAFRERHPDEPAAHLEAFATWLLGAAAGRPVVAWNGYRFDFPVIRDHLREHCPEYVDDWESRYQFDPLHWAARQGNAALPGHSNELDVVAGALGYEPTVQGLDGEAVADVYADWRGRAGDATDRATTAPDWDRLEAYCEDDVRALATVYEAIDAAASSPGDGDAPGRDDAESRQGSFSDFS